MRTVVVTGASGFVGGHACRDLAAAGWAVRALVRRPWREAPEGVTTVVVPDGSDDSTLHDAVVGATAVVHLAGRAHVLSEKVGDGREAFRIANVHLTVRLLRTAEAAGATRFVFVSSIGAVCAASEVPVTDDTLPAPRSAYGISKLEAEGEVLARPKSSMRTVILRPPMVYGPGMRGNPLRLFDLVGRGVPLPLGAVRNRRTLLYVGNLTAAIGCTLDSEVTARAFAVADDTDLSTPDLIRAIAASLGIPARLFPVPVPMLRALGMVGSAMNHVVRIPITLAEVDRLADSLPVDYSGFASATGYRPFITMSEGLRRTARWYRAREV